LWLAAVAAGIVSISAASVWMLDRGSGKAITTIAVLPFKDTSPQKDLDYLCDGITDEMIEALSQISGLRVTARGSAFQFKNKNEDVRAVGSKLGVEAVLEGTVRYEGDYLLIEAELVSTRSGYRLWAKSYDHEAGDVFAIQRGISRSVAEALRQRVGYDLYVPRRYTADPATYDTYLKGRSALATQPIQALAFFDQALKRDPQYAPAYAGLAVAYSQMWIAGVNPDQTLPKAKEATEAALKLNDGLAEAHLAKAVLLARNWDWPGAIAETDRALRLSPSLGPALWKKGTLLLIIGREQDARSAFEYAEAIDPMAPDLFQMKIESLLGMKRFDEMIKLARQYPYAPASAYFLGKAYAEKGMMTEALEKLELHRVRGGQGYGMLTAAYVRTGRRSDALRLLDEVRETAKRRYVRASSIAAVYLALGDLDQGFRWLDRAVDEHDPTLCWLRLDSAFAPARNDPRFHSLLKKVHLDE
jgi:TolB-like protein/tetratricopeptide (TPR) repeat protein